MDSIERVGKTVEDAIQGALRVMLLTRDEVDVKVLFEGKAGFLGFGSKPARVLVSRKIEPVEEKPVVVAKPEPVKANDADEIMPKETTEKFLQAVIEAIGLQVRVDINQKDKHLYVNMTGNNMGVLIGKRGQTLDALQYLTNLVVNRCDKPKYSVILDTENYRRRRRETLEALALSLARKVKITKKNRWCLNP